MRITLCDYYYYKALTGEIESLLAVRDTSNLFKCVQVGLATTKKSFGRMGTSFRF